MANKEDVGLCLAVRSGDGQINLHFDLISVLALPFSGLKG